jgi:hypothetical protein
MSLGPAHVFFKLWGETEPDLHLIKQVEQVTTSALEGPAWRFAGIFEHGNHGRCKPSYF